MAQQAWKQAHNKCVQHFTYDFSVHGGAVGTIALGDLPTSFIITHAYAYVETALVGGGTFVVGEDGGGDADGYFLDLDAKALASVTLGSGALIYSSPTTAAEIGNEKPYVVASATDGVQVTIASTAYTAGKIHFIFEGHQA